MADPLTGIISDDKAQRVVDFLGRDAQLSFTGQPALPAGAPAPSPSAATPGASGVGATPASSVKSATESKPGQGVSGFDSSMLGGDGSSAGGLGTEGGAGGLPGFSFNSGQFSFSGSPFGVSAQAGPFGVGVGPSGSVSAGLSTGNKTIDSVLNTALSMVGLQTSVNPGALLSALMNSPVLGAIASTISALGAPMAAIQLAHNIALGIPGSTINMQAAQSEFDPTGIGMLTEEEAAVAGKFGLAASAGPKVGGAQPIGILGQPFENELMGPQGATFGLDFSNPSVSQGFAANLAANPTAMAIAQALGYTGRGVDDPGQAPTGPAGPGPSAAPSAEDSGGGPGPGPGPGEGAAASDSGTGGPW